MIVKTEIFTLHVSDLLELLGAPVGAGSLTLVADGDELAEFDLEDLCLSIAVAADDDPEIFPFDLEAE